MFAAASQQKIWLARLTISAQDIQAAIRQIMTWAEEWDWKMLNL
jgi:hypothetical protein